MSKHTESCDKCGRWHDGRIDCQPSDKSLTNPMTKQDDEVLQGDCLELMKDIPDGSVDMILADLPYGTTACKWDTIIPFEPLWEQYKRIIKPNGAIVLTASQPFTSALVMSNPKMFKYEWIWEKTRNSNPFMAKIQPLRHHESVLVFGDKKIKYFPQMTESDGHIVNNGSGRVASDIRGKKWNGKSKISFAKYPKSLFVISNPSISDIKHPTQKPVALFEYLIKTYTNEGDLVLDNVAGSGTTGVACQNLNRNFILMEQEPEYVEIIKKRLELNKDQPNDQTR